MGDEPTAWELARAIEQIRRDLSAIAQSTVSAPLFASELRRLDERFAELARELKEHAEDQARQRAEQVKEREELRAEQVKEREERRQAVRWLLASIALPVASIVVAIYLGLAK